MYGSEVTYVRSPGSFLWNLMVAQCHTAQDCSIDRNCLDTGYDNCGYDKKMSTYCIMYIPVHNCELPCGTVSK